MVYESVYKKRITLTQENGGINWQITTHADTPHCGKGTKSDIVWRGATGSSEDTNDKQGDIEGPSKKYEYTCLLADTRRDQPAAPDIRANAPEDRANQEADILWVR